jgi:hypothetical protein
MELVGCLLSRVVRKIGFWTKYYKWQLEDLVWQLEDLVCASEARQAFDCVFRDNGWLYMRRA